MVEVEVSSLKGVQLDWAVLSIEEPSLLPPEETLMKLKNTNGNAWKPFELKRSYSTDWSISGPIIERELIGTVNLESQGWKATAYIDRHGKPKSKEALVFLYDDTYLGAAMKAYVSSKRGASVKIPAPLVEMLKTKVVFKHNKNPMM